MSRHLPEGLGEGVVRGILPVDARGARFAIQVGDESVIASAEIVSELGLSTGTEIDGRSAGLLLQKVRLLALFDRAVGLLAVRGMSSRQLAVRLRRLGAGADEIPQVTARLAELGLLNDAQFANARAARASVMGIPKRRIEQDLRRRGVDGQVAAQAAAAATEEAGGDELGAARILAQRRLPSLASLDARAARRRLYAFLARRGYSSTVTGRVVEECIRELGLR